MMEHTSGKILWLILRRGTRGLLTVQLVCVAQGKLSGWIRLPKSAALPFGSFEEALDASPSKDAVLRKIAAADGDPSAANLASVRCAASFVASTMQGPCVPALQPSGP